VATVTDLFGRVETVPGGIGWSAVTSASEAIWLTTCLGSFMGLAPFSVDPSVCAVCPPAVGAPP
jgi:hypothetical protein